MATTSFLLVAADGERLFRTWARVPSTKENTLLSNLFVRMLRHMGIEAQSFGASGGVISEV